MTVYMIRSGKDGPIKIGVSQSVFGRMAQLQTSHFDKLTMLRIFLGEEREERWLHEHFAEHRLHGEWFRFTEAMTSIRIPNLEVVRTSATTLVEFFTQHPDARVQDVKDLIADRRRQVAAITALSNLLQDLLDASAPFLQRDPDLSIVQALDLVDQARAD